MFINYLFIISVTFNVVLSQDCVTYTFGEDFQGLFSNDFVGCTNHQWERLEWTHNVYNNTRIDPPNGNSKWFITPPGGFACTSSFPFEMNPDGLLEVLTYREPTAGNSLSILVHEYGSNRLAARHWTFENGWAVTKIPLSFTTNFTGYITFTGTRQQASFVIIDSFRYVAPTLNPEECVVYPDDAITTLPALSTTTVPTLTTDTMYRTTTDTATINDDCVKYTFEKDFEELFTITPCSEWFGVETPFTLDEYANVTVKPQNDQSKSFISPSISYSCVSSFNFLMTANGLVEVHAYIDKKAEDDYLEVWVFRLLDSSHQNKLLVGHGFLHGDDNGWHVMSIHLSTDTDIPFEGYITFTGQATENSHIIVDSFRYIAPSLDYEECSLYPNEPTTATPPNEIIIMTTTDREPFTTTDWPDITDEESYTTTDWPATTDEDRQTTTDWLATTNLPATTDEEQHITTDWPATTDGESHTTTNSSMLTTTDGDPDSDEPTTPTDGMFLTTTERPGPDPDNPFEKIIIIKKMKVVRKVKVIKKFFTFNNETGFNNELGFYNDPNGSADESSNEIMNEVIDNHSSFDNDSSFDNESGSNEESSNEIVNEVIDNDSGIDSNSNLDNEWSLENESSLNNVSSNEIVQQIIDNDSDIDNESNFNNESSNEIVTQIIDYDSSIENESSLNNESSNEIVTQIIDYDSSIENESSLNNESSNEINTNQEIDNALSKFDYNDNNDDDNE